MLVLSTIPVQRLSGFAAYSILSLAVRGRFPKIKSSCQMTRNDVFNSVYHVNFLLRVRKIISVVDNANSFTSSTGSSRVKHTFSPTRFFNVWQPGAPIYQFYVHLNIKCCSVSFSARGQLSVSFFLTLICLVATTYQNYFSYDQNIVIPLVYKCQL